MLGIVIPAHNEEKFLPACLRAIGCAARHPGLNGEQVAVVVVLDSCTDRSALVATQYSTPTITIGARNVGMARAAGASVMLENGARWLAFTDADSRVAPDWLVAQQALRAEAVCGVIAVDDWCEHDAATRETFYRSYIDADGHRHVHGANLGVSARAYRRAGGFQPIACSEDVALVDMLIATGTTIAWSAAPRVITSARRASKARGGFGDTLAALGD
ncbi:glycosyltransferase [Paraburkholderia hospita]|jgi:glycosyltransferase involved in cell wall biosynthesis|uniref:glycosyltransferase n=1 Tax=Paraburkholderia hospita TaxID=169430 RepID=UPI0009A6CF56|nr:glycosyltransferase [Paraburkholderia hospita]SKC88464.1 Glycosyl transferase family 2 [Paraburkholderia hospita]